MEKINGEELRCHACGSYNTYSTSEFLRCRKCGSGIKIKRKNND